KAWKTRFSYEFSCSMRPSPRRPTPSSASSTAVGVRSAYGAGRSPGSSLRVVIGKRRYRRAMLMMRARDGRRDRFDDDTGNVFAGRAARSVREVAVAVPVARAVSRSQGRSGRQCARGQGAELAVSEAVEPAVGGEERVLEERRVLPERRALGTPVGDGAGQRVAGFVETA